MNYTTQKIVIGNANDLSMIKDKSINLIITSPPYPMITMWDEIFNTLNPNIAKELIEKQPMKAFDLMHIELEKIYIQAFKKLKDDGVIVINIGDATRTCNKKFSLFANGARTIEFFTKNGFSLLPSIIWNKPTNSPNKFMGSGMLPVGAYNTLEYEHILIFKKEKRNFKTKDEKTNRNNSAFFWNERNIWCNNIWNFVGERQKNKNSARERSGAYPLELPFRIISMWSCQNDIILDLFGGTGTTLLACTMLKRNGIVIEIEPAFKNEIVTRILESKDLLNKKIQKRLDDQVNFIKERNSKGHITKYENKYYQIPVITKQEQEIKIPFIENTKVIKNNEKDVEIKIDYQD